jgi:Na+-translocating ferredoxin:NAD+ oxidoreductase RnfA subunit
MTAPFALSFLTGLLALNPWISLGLIPTAAQGASLNHRQAFYYGLLGALTMLAYGLLAWLLHFQVIAPMKMAAFELPLLLLMMPGLNWALARLLKPWPRLEQNLPVFHLNFPALAAALVLLQYPPASFGLMALTLLGMSASFLASLVLVSHLRVRLETGLFHKPLKGWPSFLLASGILWVAFQGLLMLVK